MPCSEEHSSPSGLRAASTSTDVSSSGERASFFKRLKLGDRLFRSTKGGQTTTPTAQTETRRPYVPTHARRDALRSFRTPRSVTECGLVKTQNQARIADDISLSGSDADSIARRRQVVVRRTADHTNLSLSVGQMPRFYNRYSVANVSDVLGLASIQLDDGYDYRPPRAVWRRPESSTDSSTPPEGRSSGSADGSMLIDSSQPGNTTSNSTSTQRSPSWSNFSSSSSVPRSSHYFSHGFIPEHLRQAGLHAQQRRRCGMRLGTRGRGFSYPDIYPSSSDGSRSFVSANQSLRQDTIAENKEAEKEAATMAAEKVVLGDCGGESHSVMASPAQPQGTGDDAAVATADAATVTRQESIVVLNATTQAEASLAKLDATHDGGGGAARTVSEVQQQSQEEEAEEIEGELSELSIFVGEANAAPLFNAVPKLIEPNDGADVVIGSGSSGDKSCEPVIEDGPAADGERRDTVVEITKV